MASESVSFDFLSHGAPALQRDFIKTGDSATLAAKGARLLADAMDKQRKAAAVSAGATLTLAKADKILADAEDELSGKAGETALALRAQADEAKKAREQNDRLAASNKLIDERTSKIAGAGFFKPSPLLAALPLAIPAATALASVTAAIAVSAGAAAIGMGTFGLLAKQAFTTASTAAGKVQAAQNAYNVAIASGVKHATAYATEQKAIRTAYVGLSPQQIALSRQVGALSDAWQSVQKRTEPIVSGALVPWMRDVSILMKDLVPLVRPVAGLFAYWGQVLHKYLSSGAGSAEIHKMAVELGNFSAAQLSNIINFVVDIGKGIGSLARDLAAHNVDFYGFGRNMQSWGDAFAHWASSSRARADVGVFLRYLHSNGPLLAGVVRDLAKFIPGIFAGASAAGTLELRVLSDFLGWVAKLPPSWAKPVTELAGAVLLLSKTGVVSVGIKLAGAAAKLISGGTLSLGGAAAGGEIEAAFRTGGAAAAAEIRAAMTGGAAVSGGESAAAGAAAGAGSRFKGLGAALGGLLAGGVIAGVNTKLPGMHKTLWQAGDPPPRGQQQTWLNSWAGLGDAIVSIFGHVRHDISAVWDLIFNNTIGRIERGRHDISAEFDTWRHHTAAIFDGARHDIAHTWDLIWNNTVTRVTAGVGDVVSWFRKLPGQALGALRGFGVSLWKEGKSALAFLWNGMKSGAGSIFGWLKGFAGGVVGIFKKVWGWFSPSSVMFEGGKSLMEGLEKGIQAHAHKARAAASAAATGAGVAARGPLQDYARKLLAAFGWAAQWPQFNNVVMRESGWNVHATNPSSGAYGIPQALPPGKMASAGADWRTSGFTQLRWMMGYIRDVYGDPARAWAHELGAGWYGSGLSGGIFTRPTLIGVGERGPERVDVTPVGHAPATSRGHGGPLVNIAGDLVVQNATDAALVAQRLNFAITAAGLGS